MPAATEVIKGFAVYCPACKEEETIAVYVHDTALFCCNGCGENFTAEYVQDWIARKRRAAAAWEALLAWAQTAPAFETE